MALLSTKDAAKMIEEKTGYPITVRQVQNEINKGYIKAQKIGGTYLIDENDLHNYERRHPGPAGKQKKTDPAKKNFLIRILHDFGLKMRSIGRLEQMYELEPSSDRKKDIKESEAEADSLKKQIEDNL